MIKFSRNKSIFSIFTENDTFSDRLLIFLFHFSFFLKNYKTELSKENAQKLFDFVIRQIELSIREIGYGDVSVNKKMKDYVNLFYSILEKIENWEGLEKSKKINLLTGFMNIKEDNDFIINYFDNYSEFIRKNPLKIFTKDILELKF